jgi:protein deglycase
MKKALVVLAEGFEDVEAVMAIDILRRAEIDVTVAALAPGLTRGSRRTAIQADALLDDVEGKDFDALVLPGGLKGAENLAASVTLRERIRRDYRAGKVIAAICASPATVLAPAGVLEGKNVTGFPGTEDKFPPSARAKTDPVVVDENLITSRMLGTALPFSLAIVSALEGPSVAEKVRRGVLG